MNWGHFVFVELLTASEGESDRFFCCHGDMNSCGDAGASIIISLFILQEKCGHVV